MVTRIRKGARLHLYIEEWARHRGLSDEALAGRLDVARETVYRWRTQQDRLNPSKIAAIAAALDLEPADLWRRPGPRSIDAILKDAPDDLAQTAFDVVQRLSRRAS